MLNWNIHTKTDCFANAEQEKLVQNLVKEPQNVKISTLDFWLQCMHDESTRVKRQDVGTDNRHYW